MRQILTIAKKELLISLTSPVGYIFAGLLISVCGWLFFKDLFVSGVADMSTYWQSLSFLLVIFIPAISMNLISEEKKNSTWEVLLTLPIEERSFVLGKFLGSASFIAGVFCLIIPAMLSLGWLGNPDWGVMIGGWLGNLLLALAFLSFGLMVSSMSNSPIVAFLISVVVLLINNLIGQEVVLSRVPLWLKEVLSEISLANHAYSFSSGMVRIVDVAFFASWIAICLMISILVLKNRGK